MLGLAMFSVFLFAAIFGPVIAPYSPNSAGSFPKAYPIWSQPSFMEIFDSDAHQTHKIPNAEYTANYHSLGSLGNFDTLSTIKFEEGGFNLTESQQAAAGADIPLECYLVWNEETCGQTAEAQKVFVDPFGPDSKYENISVIDDPYETYPGNKVLWLRYRDDTTAKETNTLELTFYYDWIYPKMPTEGNFHFRMSVLTPTDDTKLESFGLKGTDWDINRTIVKPDEDLFDGITVHPNETERIKDNVFKVSVQARNPVYFNRTDIVKECGSVANETDQTNLKCKDIDRGMISPPYHHGKYSFTDNPNAFLTVDERTQLFTDNGKISLTLKLSFDAQQQSRANQTGLYDVFIDDYYFQVFKLYNGILGSNNEGQDVFSQLIWGTYVSIIVGVVATFFSISIGIVVGLASGYAGGIVDDIIMRAVDFLLIMPGLPLLLALASILEPSFWNIIVVIALLGWTGTARLIRSQVLVEKEKAYVESAKAAGASDTYILFKHILPNVLPMVFALVATGISGAILNEAALAFLGLGDYFTPSWGQMLNVAQQTGAAVGGYWWFILPPGFAIAILSLSFALMGYTIQQILNPRLKARG
jgi:ABC-type dipeptide/oligopeptide/nickel transport system permease subunit